MKYFAVYDLVGISVDDSYPWVDTLFLNQGIACNDEAAYQKCRKKIAIHHADALPMDDVRFIGDGAYIGDHIYVDEHYGARIEYREETFSLTVTQECNEWLIIVLQLSLLACEHTLLHAAALEKEGKVLLLPSWGGVGKTATVCRFVRDYGWRLLGDDLVIIGEGRVLPFLKPFVIYPYHKNLFPELFKSGETHIVKNLALSNLMSRMIPGVKRMLRPFPRVLAYLRKHNPQSMRVPPQDIFTADQLSDGGIPVRMVWLERSMKSEPIFGSISPETLASKAAAVSSVELFAAKLEAVYHMCGCGMLLFDDVVLKMHEIILKTAAASACEMMEIPTSVSITDVGELIYRRLYT